MNTFARRQSLFSASIIILIAGFLRFYNISKQSLFLDEAWSWATSRLGTPALLRLSLTDPHPPFYYLLLKPIVLLLPHSEFGLRALSTLASLATLALVMHYLNSRSIWNGFLYAGLLIAVSPFDIYYSQEARMYTLLGFFVVCSYISLVKALKGDQNFLIVWALTAILMVWTHAYGILYAFIQIAFLSVYLLLGSRQKVFPNRSKIYSYKLWVPIVILATAPVAALVLLHSSTDIGGAWIPTTKDLSSIFVLWTAGLGPVSEYFLNGQSLELPFATQWLTFGWALVGLATYAGAAIWGIYQTWKNRESLRFEIALSLALIILPIILVYSGGAITSRRVWAFKSFLGSAYLFYLWVGIGIVSIRIPILRASLVIVTVTLAGFSLYPYYTTWNKSNAASAFQSLPEREAKNGIILEPAYLSPLAFFYADEKTPVYALVSGRDGQAQMIKLLLSNENVLGEQQVVSCAEISATESLFLYEYNERTREVLKSWPDCVISKNLYGFQENEWRPIESQTGG